MEALWSYRGAAVVTTWKNRVMELWSSEEALQVWRHGDSGGMELERRVVGVATPKSGGLEAR